MVMSKRAFNTGLIFIIASFTLFFFAYFVPPILQNPDILNVLKSGFVNPYATGYSIDLIACWLVLVLFVLYEAKTKSIRHGWVCVLLGLVPGVVVGWSLYLILRSRQKRMRSTKVHSNAFG